MEWNGMEWNGMECCDGTSVELLGIAALLFEIQTSAKDVKKHGNSGIEFPAPKKGRTRPDGSWKWTTSITDHNGHSWTPNMKQIRQFKTKTREKKAIAFFPTYNIE